MLNRYLEDHIIKSDYQGSRKTRDTLNGISAPIKEDLIMRSCGESGDFKKKMEDVRQFRNSLIHDLFELNNVPDKEVVKNRMYDSMFVLNKLSSELGEGYMFWSGWLGDKPDFMDFDDPDDSVRLFD